MQVHRLFSGSGITPLFALKEKSESAFNLTQNSLFVFVEIVSTGSAQSFPQKKNNTKMKYLIMCCKNNELIHGFLIFKSDFKPI